MKQLDSNDTVADPRASQEVDIIRWERNGPLAAVDRLAGEEPLEIRVNGTPVYVTMRTPGDDRSLAAGFLFGEGILADLADMGSIVEVPDKDDPAIRNVVEVTLDREWAPDRDRQRNFAGTSACGICGKTSIEQVRCLAAPIGDCGWSLKPAIIAGLSDRMRAAQRVFERTGGLHAAGLFDLNGTLLSLKEDVGRHNAVDKLIGAEFLAARAPLSDRIMMVSGRASFEIVQKAAVAGIAVLCAISAPSSLAAELARSLNMTLVGFLRGENMNIYSAHHRINTLDHHPADD